jgi:hypothetical protein
MVLINMRAVRPKLIIMDIFIQLEWLGCAACPMEVNIILELYNL